MDENQKAMRKQKELESKLKDQNKKIKAKMKK